MNDYFVIVLCILTVLTTVNTCVMLFGMPFRQKVTVWKNGRVDHIESYWAWNPGLLDFFRNVRVVEVKNETADDGS